MERREKASFSDTFGDRFKGRSRVVVFFGTRQTEVGQAVKRICRKKCFKELFPDEGERRSNAASMCAWAIAYGYTRTPATISHDEAMDRFVREAIKLSIQEGAIIPSALGYAYPHGVVHLLKTLADTTLTDQHAEAIMRPGVPDEEEVVLIPAQANSRLVVAVVGHLLAQ